MKERGILFSAPMVRALLAGTKTQTRRLIKPQPKPWPSNPAFILWRNDEPLVRLHLDSRSPYGVPGDRLWVRETWGFDSGVRANFKPIGRQDLSGMDLLSHVLYRTDVTNLAPKPPRWRPAIHMPRWASRVTLEITDVRAERLQSMGDADAKAEGFEHDDLLTRPTACSARDRFAILWNEINGKRASWGSNPWVWVVSFSRLAP